jgi:hypothetical protein
VDRNIGKVQKERISVAKKIRVKKISATKVRVKSKRSNRKRNIRNYLIRQ